MLRKRLTVRGTVQGVGFRWFCQTQAEDAGITGFAKNERDGSVLIEAQGEDLALERFVDAVKQGPRHSKVSELTQASIGIHEGERSFETR